jgi:MoxR-like ATPase
MNLIQQILDNSENILNGKKEAIKLSLCALYSKGHVLIEDVPGVGKTTLVKMLSHFLSLNLARIQFTNDILPSDIIGSNIYDKDSGNFLFQEGPIFGEIVLADELNRAPAKTQSALLQAMEEKKVTVDGKTYSLPDVFTVFATQNPHSQIGTYELPESQLDRFTLKFSLGYPEKAESIQMLKSKSISNEISSTASLGNRENILNIQKSIEQIHMDNSLFEYIYDLLTYTRQNSKYLPLSNRCGIDLVRTARSWAYVNEKEYVIIDDLQYLFPYVAGHRLINPGQATNEEEKHLAKSIIKNVPVRK